MSMDAQTLYMVMGVSCFIVAAAFLFFQARQFRTDGVRAWSAGYAFQGIYWVFLGLRGVIPDFLSILVANAFLTANYSLLYAAVREFQHRSYRRDFLFLPAIVTIIYFLFFWAYVDSIFSRTVYISLVSAIQMGFVASILFRERPFQIRRSQWLTGSFFAMGALLWLVRFMEVLVSPYRGIHVLGPSIAVTVLLLMGFGVVFLTSVGFLLMMREQAGDALQESEERFRRLADATWEGIVIHREGIIMDANEAALKMMGYPAEEAIGQIVLMFLAPESIEPALQKLKESIDTPQIYFEAKGLRKDKTVFPIEVLGGPIRYKNLDARVLAIRDVTERKRMEEALKESGEKFRSILESMNDSYFETDLQGNMTFFNPMVPKSLGYSPEEIAGMNHRVYMDAENAEIVERNFREVYRENLPSRVIGYVITRKDGTKAHVETSFSLIKNKDGQSIGYRGMSRDITDRKLAEDAFQKAREMLVQSEKLAALGKLSAGASHEILNPLNILSLRFQVLEMTENLSDKTKEALKIAKVQVERIVKITHSIREFSRTKALYVTTVDLRELMEDVFSLTASRLKAENVTFDFQYQADIPPVSLDKFRIEQVILNLVNNAIDAMKDGKEKLLRVTASLESSEGQRNVRISFSDNGTGIKAEDMNRIFEPFFTTKDPDKGKGLGLSVCYGIIQDHNGTIRAENNEQGGATFIIELPV
jgi:PAS domain S-box-containing protein